MILFCIAAGIGCLIGLLGSLTYGDPIEGMFGAIFGTFVGGVLGFLIALIVGAFAYTGTHWEQDAHKSLVSMDDGASIRGSFFLGSGYIDETPSFTWYESDGLNNYVRKDADASVSTVHYLPEGQVPYYTLEHQEPDDGFVQDWGWGLAVDGEQRYDFYVPRGSIVQSYRLDNK